MLTETFFTPRFVKDTEATLGWRRAYHLATSTTKADALNVFLRLPHFTMKRVVTAGREGTKRKIFDFLNSSNLQSTAVKMEIVGICIRKKTSV